MRKLEIDDQLRIIRWQFAIRFYTKFSMWKFGKFYAHIKLPMGSSLLIGFFRMGIDLSPFMKIGH
jgi:hypothetical protein